MEQSVEQTRNACLALIIVQIVLQIFMKGALDTILDFYLHLQFFQFLIEYDIQYPSQVDFMFEQLENLIQFKFLNPDFIIKRFIDKDKNLIYYIGMLAQKAQLKIDLTKNNFIEEYQISQNTITLAVLGCLLIVFVIMFCLCGLIISLLKKYREEILKTLAK